MVQSFVQSLHSFFPYGTDDSKYIILLKQNEVFRVVQASNSSKFLSLEAMTMLVLRDVIDCGRKISYLSALLGSTRKRTTPGNAPLLKIR